MNTWRPRLGSFNCDRKVWSEKMRFSIPKKKKKKKTQRELHTRAHKWKQTHVHLHTYTPWHHKSALWHHQHWLLTCGFVFSLWLHQQLFVLENTNVRLSLSSFFLFLFFLLFLNSTIKFEYWKSRITHLKFTEIFKKINTCLSKRQKEKFMIRAFVFWSRGEVFTRYDHKHVCRSKRLKMAGRKRRSVINHHLSLSEYNSEWDAEKPQTKGLRSPFKPRGGWIQPHRPAGPSHSQRNLKKCTKYDIIMATASPAKQSYHGRVFVCSFDFLHVAQKVPLLCRIFLHVLCFSLDARRRRRRN